MLDLLKREVKKTKSKQVSTNAGRGQQQHGSTEHVKSHHKLVNIKLDDVKKNEGNQLFLA